MIRRAKWGLAVMAALATAGCQADDVSHYKAPIAARQAEAPKPAEGGGAESFAYRLDDLRPSYRPDVKSDEAGLWMLFDNVEARTRSAGNRVNDPRLNAYIESVVCRVAGPYCGDIRVYVTRMPLFNATMAPNGMMEIWTGLLLRAQNEAQLATVIGHEIGHYLRRHSAQRVKDMIEKSNTSAFLQLGFALAGIPAAGEISHLIMLGSIQAFGRNQEREADGYGILLLAESGYDPDEAWKIWDFLKREREGAKDAPRVDLFLASHPPGEERLETLRALADHVRTPRSTETGHDRYLAAILPIREGLLRDTLHLRRYDEFGALIDLLMEEGANKAELHYFRGELYRLRGKEGDLQLAVEAYRQAEDAEGKAPADLHRQIGVSLGKMGEIAEAHAALRHYLESNPDAGDAGMIRHMLETRSP